VAGLARPGALAGKALQLRAFAPLLFISAPPGPLNLTEENEENEELRCLYGLLSESRAVRLPFHPLAELCARPWPSG